MYSIKFVDKKVLKCKEVMKHINSPFCTYEWVVFLEKNQDGQAVVLELTEKENRLAIFVGVIVKKFGVRILGSPFDGWLTPDMGFIRFMAMDDVIAIETVKRYAFKELRCIFLQISDKSIQNDLVLPGVHTEHSRILYKDNSVNLDSLMESFSKNGRRDVRASARKGLVFKEMPFDKEFADAYYDQLIDVFDKQNLKPSYDLQKVYDLVEVFETIPEQVFAVGAFWEGKCVATVFSFGFGNWTYYMGAASYRDYQKYLPNEGLFWEFIKHWNENGISNIDMVGYREYKLKYNPEIIRVPVFMFQKYPFLLKGKELARKAILLYRKLKGLK